MVSTSSTAAGSDPYAATESETTQGKVYTVTGQDWDSLVADQAERGDERIVVNMGPQHPSTHGVLRLILELEGETVTEARCGIGYLHTGIEKNMEFRNWTQGVTFCTRMDYLSPLSQETTYCLGVGDAVRVGVARRCGSACVDRLVAHQLYDLRSSGGGICAPLYSTGMPPRG